MYRIYGLRAEPKNNGEKTSSSTNITLERFSSSVVVGLGMEEERMQGPKNDTICSTLT